MPQKAAIYLHNLELKDYKSFNGTFNFDFSSDTGIIDNKFYYIPQCTVLLGDNGTGKTNILKVIANLQPELVNIKDVETNNDITDYHLKIGITNDNAQSAKEDGDNPSRQFRPVVYERVARGKYQAYMSYLVYNGAIKKINRTSFKRYGNSQVFNNFGTQYEAFSQYRLGYGSTVNFVEYDASLLSEVKIYAYGVNRFADNKRNLNSTNLAESLFRNDCPLINLEEWLMQLEIASNDTLQGKRALNRIRQIKNILSKSNLFPDVTDYRLVTDDNLNSSIQFVTKFGELPYHALGYGYQCMMAWVFDFMKKMFDRYPDSDNPLSEPAILLIDEIDLHLHPNWQRHVLRDLCDLFPATQIIVSTHSPLVIQSASSMNLFLLTNENGCSKIEKYPTKTFQGWSVEEILNELMIMGNDTRSDEYQKLRNAFEHAMNEGNVKQGIKYYSLLKDMLYPGSAEREILDIDYNLLKSSNHD